MGAIKKPSTSNYDRFIAWCEKYKYPMMGEGAELNPYEGGLCNQLTNIWFYAIFVVLAIFVNLYLVVDEQLNIQFTKGEDNEIDEMNLVDHPYKDLSATSQESAPIRTQPKLML
ncbi:UNVERIFIED_CONTAM: hypothetical protein HDU68_011129 [Siphonaria sp. JEL0065]|nr:hypothetical protein HDU68_011129 [Siphonaria sp. JEL0065]